MKTSSCVLSLTAISLLSSVSLLAKEKKVNDLASKVNPAALICVTALSQNAKDPSSLTADDTVLHAFGSGLFRDHIYITLTGMGRNTYGAILRHTWTCDLKCRVDQPCTLERLSDE